MPVKSKKLKIQGDALVVKYFIMSYYLIIGLVLVVFFLSYASYISYRYQQENRKIYSSLENKNEELLFNILKNIQSINHILSIFLALTVVGVIWIIISFFLYK